MYVGIMGVNKIILIGIICLLELHPPGKIFVIEIFCLLHLHPPGSGPENFVSDFEHGNILDCN